MLKRCLFDAMISALWGTQTFKAAAGRLTWAAGCVESCCGTDRADERWPEESRTMRRKSHRYSGHVTASRRARSMLCCARCARVSSSASARSRLTCTCNTHVGPPFNANVHPRAKVCHNGILPRARRNQEMVTLTFHQLCILAEVSRHKTQESTFVAYHKMHHSRHEYL